MRVGTGLSAWGWLVVGFLVERSFAEGLQVAESEEGPAVDEALLHVQQLASLLLKQHQVWESLVVHLRRHPTYTLFRV